MNQEKDIRMKVQEAMESLEGMVPAEPAPFFYTRVMARISGRRRNFWEDIASTVTRPAVAILSITLVLFMNTFVILSESATHKNADTNDVTLAEEYNRTASFYDLENSLR